MSKKDAEEVLIADNLNCFGNSTAVDGACRLKNMRDE